MLKDAISLPGLSTRWMFATVDQTRSLRDVYAERLTEGLSPFEAVSRAVVDMRVVHNIDWDNADMLELIKRNTVGGPSIVFNRYHEKNVTRVSSVEYGEDARLCKRIMGVDANALYLYCIAGELPVGQPRRRLERNGLAIDSSRGSQKGKTAQGWLAWVEFSEGSQLRTALIGGEQRVGRHGLPVDGYCSRTRTVFQFHGCFWHGHGCCESTSRSLGERSAEDRLQETLAKEHYVKAIGHPLRVMWECEWRRAVNSDPTIKTSAKSTSSASAFRGSLMSIVAFVELYRLRPRPRLL